MIKVEKPSYSQETILNECISNIRDGERLQNINGSKSEIKNKSLIYDELASGGKLASIPTHEVVPGGATKADMVWLYDNKFVKSGGRKYYDKIMLLPKHGICPLCGKRVVSTLDHHLPKTEYPTYAITPTNLIAACADCNKAKSNNIIESRDKETIHPYYDDFNDRVWIRARIIEGIPIGFNFFVDKPENWTEEKFERAKNHFKVFRLNHLYSAHASDAFVPYRSMLKRRYSRGGVEGIKEDLRDQIEVFREARLNSWEAAMYEAILNSEWFFNTYLLTQIVEI